jgi:hypothetical protein
MAGCTVSAEGLATAREQMAISSRVDSKASSIVPFEARGRGCRFGSNHPAWAVDARANGDCGSHVVRNRIPMV